jgi:hypothetical protein
VPFADLAAHIRGGFDLPYAGRVFFVPHPNARDGVWLQALMDGAAEAALTHAIGSANRKILVEDEQERTAYQLALGPAYEEMVAANVPYPVLRHAGMTAWLYWTRGEEAAERYWERLADPKAGAPATEQESSPTGGSPPGRSTPTPA